MRKTVYHSFRLWKLAGIWEPALTALRQQTRTQMGRDPEREPPPSLIVNRSKRLPSQAPSAATMRGKKIWGRKRHLLVETQGFLLAVKVHAANIADRDGARLLLGSLRTRFPRLRHLFADKAYTGPLGEWIQEELGWKTEIVPKKENDSHQHWVLLNGIPILLPKPKRGFQVHRQRWKVERTLGWLIRYRRLARDYESLPSSSQAFIQIASLRLLLLRLTPFFP